MLGMLQMIDSIPKDLKGLIGISLCVVFDEVESDEIIRNDSSNIVGQMIDIFKEKDTLSYNQVMGCYNFAKMRADYINRNYSGVLQHSILAYAYATDKSFLKVALLETFEGKIHFDEDTTDSFFIIDTVCSKCGCCHTIQRVLDLHRYLLGATITSKKNNINQAQIYIEAFEAAFISSDLSFLDRRIFGEAYGEMWAYWTRKSKYEQSGEWIERGLKLDPNNELLKRKKKTHEEFMRNR
jgi:hypothetical protein